MFRRVLITLILSMLIASCGAAPAPTQSSAEPTQEVTSEPTNQPVLPENTPTAEPTSTIEPTPTIILPTPTDTPLPPLELPTEIPNAPSLLAWDGTPTYLGDSKPGYDFRVYYDPQVWALTEDQFGFLRVFDLHGGRQ